MTPNHRQVQSLKTQCNAAQTGTTRLEDLVTKLRRKTEYYRTEHDAMQDQLVAAENKHKVRAGWDAHDPCNPFTRCLVWQSYAQRPRLWKDGIRWAEVERSTVQNAIHGDKLSWEDAAAAVVTVRVDVDV